MANRTSVAVQGAGLEAIVRDLYRRIAGLESNLKSVQTASNRWLPGEFRYEVTSIGGARAVVIHRVTTGNTETITGGL